MTVTIEFDREFTNGNQLANELRAIADGVGKMEFIYDQYESLDTEAVVLVSGNFVYKSTPVKPAVR